MEQRATGYRSLLPTVAPVQAHTALQVRSFCTAHKLIFVPCVGPGDRRRTLHAVYLYMCIYICVCV